MEKDKPFLEVPKQLSHSLAIWAIYAHAHIAPPVAKFVSLNRNRTPFMLK